MGYNTDFFGSLELNKRLDDETKAVLNKMFTERHEEDSAPSFWCDLTVFDKDGKDFITWNGNEKTYELDRWLVILCHDVLAPRGYVLNGELEARGEDYGDIWKIVVKDNDVSVRAGHVEY